jgi:hypothetical protein
MWLFICVKYDINVPSKSIEKKTVKSGSVPVCHGTETELNEIS